MTTLDIEIFVLPTSDEARARLRDCFQKLQDRDFDAVVAADEGGDLAELGDLDDLFPDGAVAWHETEDYFYLGLETDAEMDVAPLTAFLVAVGGDDIEGRMWLPDEEVYQYFDQDAVYEAYGDRDWTVMVRPISLMSETIALTADVSEETRKELEALAADDDELIEDDGEEGEFAIQPAPTEATTLIVTGDDADAEALAQAHDPGVRVISESELRALMEAL